MMMTHCPHMASFVFFFFCPIVDIIHLVFIYLFIFFEEFMMLFHMAMHFLSSEWTKSLGFHFEVYAPIL